MEKYHEEKALTALPFLGKKLGLCSQVMCINNEDSEIFFFFTLICLVVSRTNASLHTSVRCLLWSLCFAEDTHEGSRLSCSGQWSEASPAQPGLEGAGGYILHLTSVN